MFSRPTPSTTTRRTRGAAMQTSMSTLIDRYFGPVAKDQAFAMALRQNPGAVGSLPGSGSWDPAADIKAIIQRTCSGSSIQLEALIAQLDNYIDTLDQAYAGTLGVLMAQLDAKPNNSVTPSGNNPAAGATYPPLTPIPLFIRTAGVVAAQ